MSIRQTTDGAAREHGVREGVTSADAQRMKELERQN